MGKTRSMSNKKAKSKTKQIQSNPKTNKKPKQISSAKRSANKGKNQKEKAKKYAIIGVIVFLLIFLIFIPRNKNNENSKSQTIKQDYYDNEQVDVNGLTISEACEKVREKGWTISSVDGVHNSWISEYSDCSDTEHRVNGVDYHTDKSIWDKPKVSLKFASDKVSQYDESQNSSQENEDSASSQTENTNEKSTFPNEYGEIQAALDICTDIFYYATRISIVPASKNWKNSFWSGEDYTQMINIMDTEQRIRIVCKYNWKDKTAVITDWNFF